MELWQTQWKDLSTSQRWAMVLITMVVLTCIVLVGVSVNSNKEEASPAASQEQVKRPSRADIASLISSQSRLFTAEVSAQKTMHYTSTNAIDFQLLGQTKRVKVPFGTTEAYIPVTASYKAMIDLALIDSTSVNIINDSTIQIVLPDPKIMETAVTIDHQRESVKSQMLAKKLDDKTYQRIVTQAKDDIWSDISNTSYADIVETAKISATDIILPILTELGFQNVQVGYRSDIHTVNPRSFLVRMKE